MIVIYEGMKRATKFEKGHFRCSNRQKNSWVHLLKGTLMQI